METFADVLHEIIDTVLAGDVAEKAHAIIDQASGQRTVSEEPEAGAAETTADPSPVPGAEEPPPTPGG